MQSTPGELEHDNIKYIFTTKLPARPHSQLPQLQKAIPFPPPAVLQTTLPAETRVIPAPKFSTILPPSTKILLPVLPETVPLIAQVSLCNTPNIFHFNQIFSAQVPDVVATTQEARKPENKECAGKEVVEISQVLPGYARSYAGDYVPNEVGNELDKKTSDECET